jgi:signal transduction histidine kinase
MTRPSPLRIWPPLAFAVAVFATTYVALALTREMGNVAAVWSIDALVTAFLVRWARDPAERRLSLALSAAAMVFANILLGSTPLLAVLMVGFNLVEIGVATWIVGRWGGPIDTPKAFAAYVLGPVLLCPAFTGAGAAAAFALLEHAPNPAQIALRWFFADGLGMAIVGSFALTVRLPQPDRSGSTWGRFLVGQAVVLAAAGLILFRPGVAQPPALFMLFPFLVAGALSHRELGGVSAVVLTSLVAWGATLLGRGPAVVADLASVDRILLMQLLLAAMVFTVLPISALLRRLDDYARELDERRARAEELNALKTRLLAHVSHEIRSPLSGVTGLAQLMRDGALGELTPAQRDTLMQIVLSGAEVDQLARDLTDAAAIQSGKARVQIGEVRVCEAIRSVVSAARFRMAEHQAEIEIVGASEGVRVAADPLRLRQILVNLLVNAAKYGGRPARVRIAAVETSRGSVRFEISDNGAGVPHERRADLFKDFERLGAETSDLEGAGLGLALSHEIARLQNGALGVGDGELGGGLFWLELPVWREEAAAA